MTPTNPTDEQMKPCPFCGKEGLLYKAKSEGPPYIAGCGHCEASLSLEWIEDEAIRAWNTRATEARAQGLVDALTASALRFREYEASHAAKGNLDGDAKARRNCEMAEQCEQALATWRRT